MEKVSYEIKGFDCASCALNAEKHLNTCKDIETAQIDFINSKMVIIYKDKQMSIEQLKKEIKKVEEDEITIEPYKFKSNQRAKIFDKELIILIIRAIISAVILIVTFFTLNKFRTNYADYRFWIMLSLYIVSYLVIAYDYIFKFFTNIIRMRNIFDEITLMVIASVGAFAIGEYPEGILVILLSQVGEMFEHVSVNKSKNIIVDAIDMRAKTATLVKGDKLETLNVEDIKIGDELLVKVGEVFPVDGYLLDHDCVVDESNITGEFAPRNVSEGQQIYSGSTLKVNAIKIKASSTYEDSTTSKILNLVIDSSQKKSKADALVSKFAKIYTPIVCLLAIVVAVFPPLIISFINGVFTWAVWEEYIYIALTFLVISCPCSIVISVPLSFFTGIALGGKRGIVIKGGNYLDKINDIKTMVFDKTGTLTTGKFSIVDEHNENIELEKFREYLYVGESLSTHPIGEAIKNIYNLNLNLQNVTNFNEISGKGLSFDYQNKHILIGNDKLLDKENIPYKKQKIGLTIVHLVVDGVYSGYISLDDTLKTNSKKMISYLKNRGIKTVILSGGNKESVERIANLLGVDEVYSNLLPQDKIDHLEKIIKDSDHAVGYVGDGINDSPSIILSDVGFAMGAAGSDSSVENADVVLMNDDPIKVVESMKIAKYTRNRALACIFISIFIKIAIMILSLIPSITLPMWVAVFADSGLAVLLIFYAVLLINKKVDVS